MQALGLARSCLFSRHLGYQTDYVTNAMEEAMRIIAIFAVALATAIGIGAAASAAADDTPTSCVAIGDGLGTVDC